MLLIRTRIAPSPIHGLGLFAREDIPAGTKVWEYRAGIDVVFPARALADAPEPFRNYLHSHAYPNPHNPDEIMIDGDDCRYMNHSYQPNIDFGRDVDSGYALVDIKAGTELTCNYEQFAPGWYEI